MWGDDTISDGDAISDDDTMWSSAMIVDDQNASVFVIRVALQLILVAAIPVTRMSTSVVDTTNDTAIAANAASMIEYISNAALNVTVPALLVTLYD